MLNNSMTVCPALSAGFDRERRWWPYEGVDTKSTPSITGEGQGNESNGPVEFGVEFGAVQGVCTNET